MALTVAVALALVVSGYTAVRRYRFEALKARYVADSVQFAPLVRFERPVLRAPERPCNAVREQNEALAKLDLMGHEPASFGDALDGKLPAWSDEILERNGAALDALAASTHCTASWPKTDPSVTGVELPPPRHIPGHLAALKLLLARAERSSQGACLAAAADVSRLAQDQGAPSGLVGAMYSVPVAKLTAHAVARCAAGVTREQLDVRAAELRILREHTLPLSVAFISETRVQYEVIAGVALLGRHILVPTDGDELDRFRFSSEGAEAMEFLVASTLPRWKSLPAADSPKAFAIVKAADADLERAGKGNRFLELLPRWSRYAEQSARMHVYLRMASVALGAAQGRDPSALMTDTELGDPFTGKPLRWRREPGKMVVWSVGPNGQDDSGADKTDDEALTISLAQ